MKRRNLWSAILFLYVLFVYSNSLKTAEISSGQSEFVLLRVLEILERIGLYGIPLTDHIIRKTAHFAEYSVMGMLLVQWISSYDLTKYQKNSLMLMLGLMIPFLDETIQLFVEGRSGQISDVWLDVSGIVFGILLLYGIKRLCRRKGVRN